MTTTTAPSPVTPPDLATPSYIGRLVSVHQTGDVLFQQGDMGREMFIVLSGEVHISKSSGESHVHLGAFCAGDFFGEMALVEGGVRTGTATVKQPDTKLVAVNQARFVYLVSQQPAFALSVMRIMGQRLEERNQRLAELSMKLELGTMP